MKYSHIVILFLGFVCLNIHAQEKKERILTNSFKEAGIPPMQNFTWGTNSDKGIRNITQHPNGLLYATSKTGIIEFDGTRWQLIYEHKSMYNLSISDEGRIYTMTSKDFGVLEKGDDIHEYHFKSLKSYVKFEGQELGFDLGCYAIGNSVFYAYNNYIFEWNGKEIITYGAENFFKSIFRIEDELYVKETGGAIYRIGNKKLIPQKETESLPKRAVVTGVRYQSAILLADNLGQFYKYDNRGLTFKFKLNDKVDFTGCLFIPIDENRLAIATRNRGVLIYNYNGELLSVLNKSLGLPTNRIHDLFIDTQNGLWITHDKGATRVEIFSPFSFYEDRNGINGRVLVVFKHLDKTYCTSKNELYQIDISEESVFSGKKFRKIFSFDASILPFIHDDVILLCTSNGLYGYQNDKLYKLTNASYSYGITSSKYENILFVAGDHGIEVLKDLGSAAHISRRFKKIDEIKLSDTPIQITNFIEHPNGDLLVNTDFKDLWRIRIGSLFSELTYEKERIELQGINGLHIGLESMDGKLAILSEGKLMIYDETTKKFKDHVVNQLITNELDFKPYFIIQSDSLSSIILSTGTPGETAIAKLDKDKEYTLKQDIFIRYPDYQIWSILSYENVIWFGGSNGLVRFDNTAYQKPKKPPAPIIKEIKIDRDSTIFKGILSNEKDNIEIPYSNNSINLKFAFPYFNGTEETRFKYVLEGFDKDWTTWNTSSEKEFNNLSEGSYIFRIKAKNVYQQESEEASFAFTILPPWYLTWWAYVLYVFGFVALITIIVQWRSKQLQKEKEILEATVKKRTTEIIHKNEQLRLQAKQLKEMDHVKSRFFANISHEFRTPITLIKGPVNDFLEKGEEELPVESIKMINRNADRLLRLVNQLLDLSKIDSGKLELEPKEGDLFYFLRVICSSFNSYASQRKIKYNLSIPDIVVRTAFDHDKLEKIIYNLLSNAFKYTPANKEVKFSGVIHKQELLFVISDTGKGIPEDQLPNIFDRFYQVDSSETRDQEGTGIGLSLTKELVHIMNGHIQVESVVNNGTTFTVRIPIKIIEKKIPKPENADVEIIDTYQKPLIIENETKTKGIDKGHPIILVVEDNDDMRKYITTFLTDAYQVLEAVNGISGLEVALREVPDLIVTDLMMPQMDGISLCKKLKSDKTTSHIPIIMLTAKAEQEDKIGGLIEGVDDYLIKPFSSRELLVRVGNLIKQRKELRTLYSQQITLEPKQIQVKSLDKNFLNQVVQSIELRLSDSGFGVSDIQKDVLMSKTQLHRKMKALTNQAPGEFLRNYRLKRATQLLSKRGGNITEVAYAVGFNSLSYFTKCFKEFYGIPPSEFLKSDRIET